MRELPEISQWVWDEKYRLKRPDGTIVDQTVDDTFRRVANALAEPEKLGERKMWAEWFFAAMRDFEFLPAGRIIAGAGSGRSVTLMNCYVMGTIEDSLSGIMDAVKEAALTLKTGGGIGMDFSTLRPRGAPVRGVESVSSGAVSFMEQWNAMCGNIMSAGSRRGAMMGVLRCDHPDLEEFIEAKTNAGRLTNFNISVAVTNDFAKAVAAGRSWALRWNGETVKTVDAREMWERIVRLTYDYAEPGVLFMDRMNEQNPLRAIETFNATNPCGEQCLPPYGACCLGSINLAKLVLAPFTPQARLDVDRLDYLVHVGIRALDNAITISSYPLPQQRDEAHNKRRIGLGVTGLADALVMLGLRYGSPDAVNRTASLMHEVRRGAEVATMSLGEEKGSFPLFDPDRFGWFKHPSSKTNWRAEHRRNSHVLSIAPTGTISSFAENVSGGIEPVFDWTYTRNVLLPDGSRKKIVAEDYAFAHPDMSKRAKKADGGEWVTATELTPQQHIDMVAAVQPYVDSAISKTINCPADMSFEAFRDVYEYAYKSGLKGCTTYRPSGVRGAVLEKIEQPAAKPEIVAMPGTNVVAMAKPLVRDEVLNGSTYKVKPAGAEHALYVTINDVEHDGRRRPFEVFFASKDVDGYPWRVALARMISAVFRKGGDVAFIAEELKAVFDPRGGTWKDGQYIPSLIAAIGVVLEQHMRKIGMIEPDEAPITEKPTGGSATGRHCPKCQTGRLIMQEGCAHCTDCSYSKC